MKTILNALGFEPETGQYRDDKDTNLRALIPGVGKAGFGSVKEPPAEGASVPSATERLEASEECRFGHKEFGPAEVDGEQQEFVRWPDGLPSIKFFFTIG